MNTIARQSISKTLVKACTAAVLLVTCFNAQATESANNQSETFRAETLSSIHADINSNNIVAPSLDLLSAAVEKSTKSQAMRTETLNALSAEDNFKPNLDTLTVALSSNDYTNYTVAEETNVGSTEADSIIATNYTIRPAIELLGNIDVEINDATSREATMIALDFAIEALESARENITVSQSLTL